MTANTNDQSGLGNSSSNWALVSVTIMSAFMVAVDSNVVSVAAPRIASDFSVGLSQVSWIITGYILASGALLLQSGRFGDVFGRKKIYLLGFVLFGFSSALCGISVNVYELILFRIIQGGSASLLTATTVPLIFNSFPQRMRGTVVGINATSWAAGALAGPLVGGILVSISWRWIFFINVPIAVLAVWAGTTRIPSDRASTGKHQSLRNNMLNSILVAICVASVLLWLTLFNSFFAILGLATFVMFVFVEKWSSGPLIGRALSSNRGFVYSILALGISQIGYLGISFILSLYLQFVLGFSPFITGAYIATLSVALVIANPVAGRLSDRFARSALLAMLGALIDCVFIILTSRIIGVGSVPQYLPLLLAVIGFGGGFIWTPSINGTIKFAPPELRGLANGTAYTLVNIGFAISIAISTFCASFYLPSEVVRRIFLENVGTLDITQKLLLGRGASLALFILGLVNLIIIPLFYLVARQQGSPHVSEESRALGS